MGPAVHLNLHPPSSCPSGSFQFFGHIAESIEISDDVIAPNQGNVLDISIVISPS